MIYDNVSIADSVFSSWSCDAAYSEGGADVTGQVGSPLLNFRLILNPLNYNSKNSPCFAFAVRENTSTLLILEKYNSLIF